MKNFLYLLVFIPLICFSNPAPFGLEIGKATIRYAKSKYKIQKIGINYYSNGLICKVNTSDINIHGLKNLSLVFDTDKKLVGVTAIFNTNEFNYYFNLLSSKYTLVHKEIPFVGNKSARFVDGDTVIFLNAPHMSFDMDITYFTKHMVNKIQKVKEKEIEQTEKNDYSSL